MILINPILLLAAVTLQQRPTQAGEIRALVESASDSVLIQRAKRDPAEVRAAIAQLRLPASAGDSTSHRALVNARRLAAAYAIAWNDSFYARQVARFAGLSIADRRATVMADSISLVGEVAVQRSGVAAAMPAWREGLRRYEELHDSAGVAESLGRLSRGFGFSEHLDSAEVYLERALDYAQRIGANELTANALAGLGALRGIRGDMAGARSYITRAEPFRRRGGDVAGLARDQNGLGNVLRRTGDSRGARRAYQQSYESFLSVGDEPSAERPLANLARTEMDAGELSSAAAHLAQALAMARRAGDRLQEASRLEDQGILFQIRGDFRSAVTAYTAAGDILRATGSTLSTNELDVRTRSAEAHSQMGDLHGALVELARAETLATRNPQSWRAALSLARVAFERGQLAQGFNQYEEAERQYVQAERLASGATHVDADVRQLAMYGEAKMQYARGDYAKARTILERLLADTLTAANYAIRARVTIADIAVEQGDTAAAIRTISQAVDSARRYGDVDAEGRALHKWASYELLARHPIVAESLAHYALTRLPNQRPEVFSELHHVVANTLFQRGALADAARELEVGIAEIERASRSVSADQYRSNYLADKWEIYIDLALLEVNRRRPAEAFRASERLRARQMLDLLANGRVAGGRKIGDLSMRERDLRRQIDELTRQRQGTGAAPQQLRGAGSAEADSALRLTLDSAQQAYGALVAEIHETSPEYAAFIRGETATASEVRAALAPDEALLEYLVSDSTTIAFVVTADTVATVDLRIGHKALRDEIDFARAALSSPRESAARSAWRAPMRRLHNQLIAPVETTGILSRKRRLVIVAHSELHYLPFAALVRAGAPERLLVEDYVTEYVPSASVWLRLRQRPRQTQEGVLALAPQPASLAASTAEVAAVTTIYGKRSRALVGPDASERAFRELAPHQRVIHVASHSVLNKRNPLFSYVALAPEGDDDGRLEVHEVFGLSLNAPLVVLSGCETAVGAGAVAEVPPGDDWLGLVQAFLFAGASNVMGTLWPVEDAGTSRLMQRFYTELASGRSPAEALARAQRAALRESATSHPFYWSGFTLVRGS
jgi:CHAT domain-containing protein/predicted negative regulator of RcsB-dependent stress response